MGIEPTTIGRFSAGIWGVLGLSTPFLPFSSPDLPKKG